jgi:uncharacterized protein (TIGR00299 family) protein
MNKNTLYLECYSGISGDMTVAALLDLGADEDVLRRALDSLNVKGYKIEIGRTKKCGIDACNFDVILEQNHDHNHEDHNHDHEEHSHGKEAHEHRNINDIYNIIDESEISERAKSISRNIFEIIARAESKAHGIDMDNVHFHEVGAIDSIVDIVAVAVCIDNLNIEDVIVSELYEGSGHVKCQHGIIPVPVPAVVNILAENYLPMRITEARGEMITPTGAAIAAALKTMDSVPARYIIKKIGIGAGKKDFEKANILRAIIIDKEVKNNNLDQIWILETNLDDSTGESLGFTMERLLEHGAKDVFYTSIYMKKNRPAYKLSVMCREEDIITMESIIFKNTTSIGIRKYKMERTVLEREVIKIETKYGLVRFKVSYYDGEKYYNPEHDDIRAICNSTGISYNEVNEEIRVSVS